MVSTEESENWGSPKKAVEIKVLRNDLRKVLVNWVKIRTPACNSSGSQPNGLEIKEGQQIVETFREISELMKKKNPVTPNCWLPVPIPSVAILGAKGG